MIDFIRGIFDRVKFGASRSSKWKSVRRKHLKDFPWCEVCHTKKRIQVHHCKPYYLFPELELDPDNLMTLCKRHHFTFGHLCDYRAYNPDIEGDALIFHYKIKNRKYD